MTISPLAKTVIAGFALVGILVFLVIVDLGVSAGRIHHGVSVTGVDLGGLTLSEAIGELARAEDEFERGLLDEPVILIMEGLTFPLSPDTVGWHLRAVPTAEKAMKVGRDGAPFGALGDRIRAWFTGVDLDWAGRPRRAEMNALLSEVERRVGALGFEVRRRALRRRIIRAIERAGEETVQIPVRPGV